MTRCVGLLLILSTHLPGRVVNSISRAEAEELIQRFGPVMRLHSTERYRMDDPAWVLDSGKTCLEWGLVHHEDEYGKFSIEGMRSAAIRSEDDLAGAWQQMARDSRVTLPGFRRWLDIDDSLIRGNQSRAKAFVRLLEAANRSYVDLQFWFFYPFNGPGKFHVTIGRWIDDHVRTDTAGRHYGDWEHVTLRLARDPWRLQDVYLSRHSISKWMGGLSALRFSGSHPIIYIARDSHAHYPSAGIHYYRRVWHKDFWLGTGNVDLEDWTDDGAVFDTSLPGHYQIVYTNVADWGLTPPAWYTFDARWGQYEKLRFNYRHIYTYEEIGGGPAGPAFHGPDD